MEGHSTSTQNRLLDNREGSLFHWGYQEKLPADDMAKALKDEVGGVWREDNGEGGMKGNSKRKGLDTRGTKMAKSCPWNRGEPWP